MYNRRLVKRIIRAALLSMVPISLALVVGITQFGWFSSSATSPPPPTPEDIASKSRELTHQLLADATTYKNAAPSQREAARATMEATAEHRRHYIIELMQEDPDEFLALAIPKDTQRELLAGVTGIETPITIEGKLEIIAAYTAAADHEAHGYDHEAHSQDEHTDCTNILTLVTPTSTKNLYLPSSSPTDYSPNSQIRITGYELGAHLVPDTTTDPANFTTVSTAQSTTPPASITEPAQTNRRVAVVLANIGDTPTPSGFTIANYQTHMGLINTWYEEASYGQIGFAGVLNSAQTADFFGIYRIEATSLTVDCGDDYASWHTQARAAATADGLNAASYQHIIVVINKPSSITCAWDGLANVNGTNVWLYAYTPISAAIHEIGHNFGLGHATRLISCRYNGVTVPFAKPTDCSFYEYGDIFSAMGNSTLRGYPAPHFDAIGKSKLGWIPAANIQTISTNQVVDIYPQEVPSTGTQLVKIVVPYSFAFPSNANGPFGAAPFYYFLETRKPYGVESGLAATPTNDFSGIQIRVGSDTLYSDTFYYQLGGFSGAPSCSGCITGLRPGMVFRDPYNPSLSIRVLSWSEEKATVDIRFDSTDPIIQNIYIGGVGVADAVVDGSTIDKVYVGSKLMWERAP